MHFLQICLTPDKYHEKFACLVDLFKVESKESLVYESDLRTKQQAK